MTPPAQPRPTAEYIILVALLTSIGAMGTDLMLPALDVMAEDLGATTTSDGHLVVTAFFLGMAFGQLVVGPLSDAYGRKPVIYAGYAVFVAGCVMSMVTEGWWVMLAGRVLQGVGAAAPRIVAMAMVRDVYEGRTMARIMSFVMAVFILVPILAPALGQGLIALGGWRSTFSTLALTGIAVSLWLAFRQTETLPPPARRAFRAALILKGVAEILRSRIAMGYTLALGLIYGAFVGYLGTAQAIFHRTFDAGTLFALYFAIAAASIGLSSLVNAALVMRFGMRRLSVLALIGLVAVSALFWLALLPMDGVPPLALFIAWQLAAFFCVGIVFANLNTLALEPLGHMAGLGAAFIGSLSTFLSLPLAALIGESFDGTVLPLVFGFASLGLATLLAVVWTGRPAVDA